MKLRTFHYQILYLARAQPTALGVLNVFGVKAHLWAAAMPGNKTPDLIKVVNEFFPNCEAAPNVLYTSLTNQNLQVHVRARARFGDQFGIPTPAIDTMINLAELVLQREFWKKGVSAESLGFKGMTSEQIKNYVMKG